MEMNAYELAQCLEDMADFDECEYTKAAHMLRQQADRIAKLEGEVSHLKHINKNWSISEGLALQRIAELEKAAQRMVDEFAPHADKCRPCTIEWQNLRSVLIKGMK